MSDDESGRLLVRGLVIPIDWHSNGAVRTMGILTDDEHEYEVAPGGAGDQLIAHLRSEILARAVLLEPAGAVTRIRIDSFAILDWKDSNDTVIEADL